MTVAGGMGWRGPMFRPIGMRSFGEIDPSVPSDLAQFCL
jgi:hypothetical protein